MIRKELLKAAGFVLCAALPISVNCQPATDALSQFLFERVGGNCARFSTMFDESIKIHPPEKLDGNLFSKDVGAIFNDSWALNTGAWDAFIHCTDHAVLVRALEWINLAIRLETENPRPYATVQYLDTRANILYKLGKVDEAVATETQALMQDTRNAKMAGKSHGSLYDLFTETLAKMKRGDPTWKK